MSRAEFEANIAAKVRSDAFLDDVRVLIPAAVAYDAAAAAELVQTDLIAKLPGEPWKGSGR